MADTNPPQPAPRRSRLATRAPMMAEPPRNDRALTEERQRLDADIAELRESEANLRAYEKRLRALQAELDGMSRSQRVVPALAPVRTKGSTRSPFSGDSDKLKTEWDKLIRARELLELEQAHVRGDRLALSDETAVVRRRAQAVAERETRVTERELALQASEANQAPPLADQESFAEKTPHMLAKMTMAPFAMTRSLLSRAKKKN